MDFSADVRVGRFLPRPSTKGNKHACRHDRGKRNEGKRNEGKRNEGKCSGGKRSEGKRSERRSGDGKRGGGLRMNIHEYQGKEILRRYGVATPQGYPCFSVAEADEAARKLGGKVWVVKAQIHAGGLIRLGDRK